MSIAGRFQIVMDLYQQPVYNEEGEIICFEPTGLITKEDVIKLLDMPDLIEFDEDK